MPGGRGRSPRKHMKMTFKISDATVGLLRREAARQGRAMSELVEIALRALLEKPARPEALAPLPEFSSGGARVNMANRDALYAVMER